jgi:hypothetical protein
MAVAFAAGMLVDRFACRFCLDDGDLGFGMLEL